MQSKLATVALAFAVFGGISGLAAAQDGRYYGSNDYRFQGYYDNDGYRGEFREGLRTARQVGYQDGMQVAREDAWRGKPFNPYPRGHDHADRGYEREFGSLHEYREHYARAYYEGYSQGYRGYGNGYYR